MSSCTTMYSVQCNVYCMGLGPNKCDHSHKVVMLVMYAVMPMYIHGIFCDFLEFHFDLDFMCD